MNILRGFGSVWQFVEAKQEPPDARPERGGRLAFGQILEQQELYDGAVEAQILLPSSAR